MDKIVEISKLDPQKRFETLTQRRWFVAKRTTPFEKVIATVVTYKPSKAHTSRQTMSGGAFDTPTVRGPTSRRDRTLGLDWVGGPDGATNGDTYKPKLKLRDDYPIEYSCEEAMEGRTESLNEVWFRYDYDLTMNGEQDSVEARRAFEWSVLWNVGVELGLYNCSMDMQDSSPNGRQRLMQQEDGTEPTLVQEPEPTRVIALGNEAEDQDIQAGMYSIFKSSTVISPDVDVDTHCFSFLFFVR